MNFLDWLSAGTILGALAGILPPAAALLAAAYYCIQIYESDTVKSWRQQRRLQRIAKLEAKTAALKAKL